jgi:hypothetical protein
MKNEDTTRASVCSLFLVCLYALFYFILFYLTHLYSYPIKISMGLY